MENFYPSISENLQENALDFAAHHTEISEEIYAHHSTLPKILAILHRKDMGKKEQPRIRRNNGDVLSKLVYSNVSQTGVWGRSPQLSVTMGVWGQSPQPLGDFCKFLEKKAI